VAASAAISDGLPSSTSVWSSAKLSAELDLVEAGISYKEACIARTIVPLLSCTYVSGLPGTLTGLGDGALGGIGGVETLVVGDRLLIKNQSELRQNGIYDITDLGSLSSPWVLTRSTDSDGSPTSEMRGGAALSVLEPTPVCSF
jgi:hypothetical protein